MEAKNLPDQLSIPYFSRTILYQSMTAKNNIKEAIVSYAIMRGLIEHGNSSLEEVYYKLYQEYALHFVDCYHNPDVLRGIMHETFGDSYLGIVELIRTHLGEFAMQEQIRGFLSKLTK
jgi:hypothetical protein